MMKYSKYIKFFGIAAIMALSACADDINIGDADENKYTTADGLTVYMCDGDGRTTYSLTELREQGTVDLYPTAGDKATTSVSVTVAYDATALAMYNGAHGTNFEAFPQECVAVGSAATIAAGEFKASTPLTLTLTSPGNLDPEATYAIPLKVTATGANVAASAQYRVILVRDLTGMPDATKYVRDADGNLVPGMKIFSCMEVNDANPLNNICFTLKSSGKPLVDAVILFSSNINYNAETGRVYVYNNENNQAIFDMREKYLKPLKERGIKVILSILGNHDRSGVANLSDEAARDFAQECKAVCDAYDLDGVFLDDEYSSYQTPVPPGFVSPSYAACSRLYYELKRAMPDRWTVAYGYGRTQYLTEIDGHQCGEYLDYALADYGSTVNNNMYPGLPLSGMGIRSSEYARGYIYTSQSYLGSMREQGYGAYMIFAMDPNRSNVNTQINSMSNIAKYLFDDELEVDYNFYKKDWR